MVDRTLRTRLEVDGIDPMVLGFEKAAIAADRLADSVERAGKAGDRLGRLATQGERVKKSIPDGKALNGLAAGLERIDKASPSLNRMSGTLLGIGAAGAAGLGLIGKAAIDWESQWAGVTKTVDGTVGQLNDLQGELRDMAKTIPATHGEIAAVAEAAGQLGVATKDVAGFTRVMLNLGETTNLTADEAATSLAQLMNVMQTAPEDVDRLGATVVDLGNKGASTEKQIVEMAQRIAAAGRQINLSESDVLGFASALASAGVEVEAGGTAISMSFKKIDSAVRTGGSGLRLIADTAGMDAAEFARAWKNDAAGAMQTFVEGLGEAQRQGLNTNTILEQLGVTGSREADALLRLASSGDLLAKSLATGNDAWEANTALAEEAAKRYATTESQIQLSLNTIKDASIDAGAAILPVVRDIAEGFAGMVETIDGLPQPVKDFGAQSTIFVAAAALIGGGAIKAVTGIGELVTSFRTLQKESPGTAKGLTGVGKAVGVIGAALAAAQIAKMIEQQMGGDTIATVEQFNDALVKMSKSPEAITDLDKLFNNNGGRTFSADLETTNITNLSDAMDRLFNKDWRQQANDFIAGPLGAFTGLGGVAGDLEAQIGKLDQSLSYMATSGAGDAAARSFDQISKVMIEEGATVDDLINKFPSYADQLRKTARETYGLTLTNQQLVDWMAGRTPAAIKNTQDATRDLETVQNDLAATQDTLTGTQEEFTKALQGSVEQFSILRGAVLDVTRSKTSFDRALLTVKESLSEETKALSASKDASDKVKLGVLDNRDALGDLVSKLNDSVTSQFKSTAETGNFTKAQDEASKALKKGRDRIVESMVAAGANREEVEKMIDQMLLTPEELKTKVDAPGLTEMQEQIEELKREIQKLKDQEFAIRAKFSSNAGEIMAQFERDAEKFGTDKAKNFLNKNGQGKYAEGGRVQNLSGKGRQLYDTEPAMLRVDEHVWTPEEVDAAGGHRAMYAMRAAAIRGELRGFARGGQVKRLYNRPEDYQDRPHVDRNITARSSTAGKIAPAGFDEVVAVLMKDASEQFMAAYGSAMKDGLTSLQQTSGDYGVIDVSNPRGLTSFRGHTFTNQAAATLRAVEVAAGRTFQIFQGGWRPATSYSGTSHAGDAIDARVDHALMEAGIRFGLKLWDRTGKGNWVSHMHGVFGPGAGFGGGSAIWQWQDYLRGGDGLAQGGYVRGPGGPTDDRVPIWASNGEYMLPEKAAKVIGPAMLERLRRLGGPMAGYATGGPIAPSAFGRSNAFDISVIVRLIRALDNPTGELAQLTKAISTARREQQKATAAQREARQDLRDTKAGSKARERAQDRYDAAADRARDSTEQLTRAQDDLRSAQEQVASAARSVSDQFRSAFESESTDPRDWVDRMRQGAAEINQFNDQLNALRKRGLSEAVIEQIMEMGVGAGTEFARQAGGKAVISELNKASQALQDAADRLGYGSATARTRRAGGGFVWGPGTSISDSIDARLSRGEYVVNAYQTARHFDTLQAINYGQPVRQTRTHYATGGFVQGNQSMIDQVALAAAVRAGMQGLRMSAIINGRTVEMIVDDRLNDFTDTMGRSR